MFELPKEVDFIQAISIDINGIARGKMFPVKKFPDLLKGKEEMLGVIEVLGNRSEMPMSIIELADCHYCNKNIMPDKETIRISPWCHDNSIAMVFFDTYELDSDQPWPFNPRLLAKNKIMELEKFGYKLLIGVENEFRLFEKNSLLPFPDKIYSYDQFVQLTMMMPYIRNLQKQMDKMDIEIDSWNLEDGQGQIEISLKPYFGLQSLDNEWFFREMSKYAADEMGMIASFMSVPLMKQSANGFHINHSLWEMQNDELHNAMGSSGTNKLSQVGKQWLAGILHHSKALCAIFCPTVNCYRRIRKANWAPKNISWNYRDRTVAMRVKTSPTIEKLNYIENRIPSSACNIYLAVAAMIVAGLDGIKRNLDLMEPGSGSCCEDLPKSLAEALAALKNNEVLVSGLGDKIVDWYIRAKYDTDINLLQDVDLDNDSEQSLKQEFDKYLNL